MVPKWLRRWWSAVTQPGSGGIIQPGDWRCRYKDGFCTHWMSHGDAKNYVMCCGGKLEWRYDVIEKIASEQ